MTEGYADLWRVALDIETNVTHPNYKPKNVDVPVDDFIRWFWHIKKRAWQIHRKALTADEIFAVMCFANGDYQSLKVVLGMIASHGECQIVNLLAWGRDRALEELKEYRWEAPHKISCE